MDNTVEYRVWWQRLQPKQTTEYKTAITVDHAIKRLQFFIERDEEDEDVKLYHGGLEVKEADGEWKEWEDDAGGDIWSAVKNCQTS